MKCERCVEFGLKSTIRIGPSSTTLMGSSPFYDEDGHYHDHDPNTTRTEYVCSQGHTTVKESKIKCPTCG